METLGRLVEKKNYTDCESENMTWQQKSDLIEKDPVNCAGNFEHMVELFLKDVLKSDEMPIGEIVDFFYRVKFKQECLFLLKEFTYLQNPLKRNVSTTYSQFPLICSVFEQSRFKKHDCSNMNTANYYFPIYFFIKLISSS